MWYAAINRYADSGSVGFSNTWRVEAFETRKARDAFVAEASDLATRAIVRRDVPRYVSRTPKPFTGQFYGISKPDDPDDRTPGLVGYVDVMSDGDEHRLVRRLGVEL